MKYTKKQFNPIVDAFKAGIDEIPDWFEEHLEKGQARMVLATNEQIFCELNSSLNNWLAVREGDYITNYHNQVGVWPSDAFEELHVKGDHKRSIEKLFELSRIADEVNLQFNNIEEVYNSLHEDLRDLRQAINVANQPRDDRYIKLLLNQIMMTSHLAEEHIYGAE